MPPSYYYHINFELYPTRDPLTAASTDYSQDHAIWQPAPGTSIFDDLPWHSSCWKEEEETVSRSKAGKATARGTLSTGRNTSSGRPKGGSHAGAPADPERATGLDPGGAAKDWRFGRVHIASFDMDETNGPSGARSGSQEKRDEGSGSSHEHGDSQKHSPDEAHGQGRPAGPAASLGPMFGGAGQQTRARYSPVTTKTTDAGWGIVHLYREGGGRSSSSWPARSSADEDGSDGTILCIPAVPGYLRPSDFLGFVGEKWRGDVSHYRMVLTSRTNRYMVLLKFRDAGRAREWRAEFDGRVFNSMESEICHVACIKSITIATPTTGRPDSYATSEGSAGRHSGERSSSSIGADTAASSRANNDQGASSSSAVSSSLRPFPPPTPNLIELPTCPVCLERMDDTAGLMTILCQHVFHCTCLQTWKGSGCPVCRATNPSPMAWSGSLQDGAGASGTGDGSSGDTTSGAAPHDANNPFSRPFGADISNLCAVCDCADDLWICLICGNVGCGRYKRGHAKDHWKETAHSFSLELETQHVWDYAGDMWVHRLIRDKGDGKVVELPGQRPSGRRRRAQGSRRGRGGDGESGEDGPDDDTDGESESESESGRQRRRGARERQRREAEDVVPAAKLEHIGMEYTHLLTSQLESQRVYFEEMVSKAADKAAQAVAAAEAAAAQSAETARALRQLREAHDGLVRETVPQLERDVERERRRADKAAELARSLGRSLQDEKKVSEGLMARIWHLQEQVQAAQEQAAAAKAAQAELEETNRDLTMFISGQEKLRELEAEGAVEAGEVAEGRVSVAEDKKGKGKGHGRRR